MTYIKCLILAPIGLAFTLLAYLISPVLPLFAQELVWGKCDNGADERWEPRLPKWLTWLQTPDNSLWGDTGWRTVHCPHYKSYLGMVKWLFRNPGYGFAWSVLAAQPPAGQLITAIGDMTVNDGVHGNAGWYLSRTQGAFRFRWILSKVPATLLLIVLIGVVELVWSYLLGFGYYHDLLPYALLLTPLPLLFSSRVLMLDVGWCMPVSGITDGSKLLFYGINPRLPQFGAEVLK